MVYIRHRLEGHKAGETVKPVVTQWRVKHKDLFDMKYFYILLREWLVDNQIAPQDTDFPEVFYLHQELKGGNNIWFWWRFSNSINKFLKFELDINCHVVLLKEVEVVHNNMKFKANNGDCEVTVNARLVYNNDFKNKGIVKIWYDVFVKRMYLAEIVSKRKEYLRICTRLMEAMKTYLKLKTYLPEPEGQKFWLNEDYE